MQFKIIEGTKKPINRSLVKGRNKPKLNKQGETIQVKNPQILFDIMLVEEHTKRTFLNTETTTITRCFHVKAFCSIYNADATHEDILLLLNQLSKNDLETKYILGNGYQYHFSFPKLFNDIYLSEFN